jgi:diguanylate cyclase (GGDEF)-like protein
MQSGDLFSNTILALLDVINDYGLGLWELSDNKIHLDQKTSEIIGLDEAAVPDSEKVLDFKDFMNLVFEADRQDILDNLQDILETPGKSGHVECRVLNKKTGSYPWIRIMGKSYLNQGEKLVLGTTQLVEGKVLDMLNAKINDITKAMSRKDELNQCVFDVTEMLLNADDETFEESLQSCLEVIALAVGLTRVYIYKNHLVDGISCCTEIYEWTEGMESTLGEDYTKDMPLHAWPGVEEILEQGRNYNKPIDKVPQEIREMLPQGVSAFLLVPIFLRDLLWGFVGYERGPGGKILAAEEESVLGATGLLLVNSVIRYDLNKNLYMAVDKINTTAIKAEVLEKYAYTDALTDLYNRRHFMELSQIVLEKARRFNSTCYAMILDLDFFKKVNDTYGHLAGDEVLKNASMVMKNTLRTYDLLARYGGEEFVVLISDTEKNDVLHLAERMRESIANTPCVYNCIKISCTVSIGVAPTFPDCTITTLIDKADKGLYQAKENGRNQVVFYDEEQPAR